MKSVQISHEGTGPARRASVVPFRHLLPLLRGGVVDAFAQVGRQAGGEVVRLGLGPFRPYLVTHPEHVQHVMRDNWANYPRAGEGWEPVERFIGSTLASEGPYWESSRKALHPVFTARFGTSIAGDLADVIAERVRSLDESARAGRPVDATETMTEIVVAVNTAFFFGERSSPEEGRRLAGAFGTAVRTMGIRQIMPFVPASVPLPGDRAFANAVRTIDEVVYPLIRETLAASGGGDGGAAGDGDGESGRDDVISALCRPRGGAQADERQVRDDLVACLVAGTDTTAHALAWLWPLLAAHPGVAARLHDEIDHVVGAGPVLPGHIPSLRYTRMVLQEVLRLYPPGWIMQRVAVASEVVGGVRVEAGSTLFVSPYVTHRLDAFWDRPLDFDPERFCPDTSGRRHRYAYFPFGGGPHQCLGRHLFFVVALLVVASVLSRFRPVLRSRGPFTPTPVALRPGQRIELDLVPAGRSPRTSR